MADLQDHDDHAVVVDIVDDSAGMALELSAPGAPRVGLETLNRVVQEHDITRKSYRSR